MGYITETDLSLYGISADATADVTADSINGAIDAASAFADGYLATQFDLPLVGEPTADIKQAVAAIAAWMILKARGFNPENPADGAVLTDKEAAVEWLKDVSRGRAVPQVTDGKGPPNSSAHLGPFVLAPVTRDATAAPTTPTRRGW